MPESLVFHAPAKLNLALSVGPPGVDRMHPICSWMVTLDLVDDLTVTRLAEDRFSRYAILWHPDARRTVDIDWPIQRDLAVRAHIALERLVGRKLPVQLKLEKRIPVGSGLGGGSSDAAAMLHAVNLLYALGLSTEQLLGVAGELGSDVAFFVRGGSAIVEGLGDRLEHLTANDPHHFVLVLPSFGCDTAQVYRAFDELSTDEASLRAGAVRAAVESGAWRGAPFNDLTPAAIRVQPALADLIERISTRAERAAHLTGSGSTVFVPCDDELHAEFLAKAIEEAEDDLVAIPARTTPGVRAAPPSSHPRRSE